MIEAFRGRDIEEMARVVHLKKMPVTADGDVLVTSMSLVKSLGEETPLTSEIPIARQATLSSAALTARRRLSP